MAEIKTYKERVLPSNPKPNAVYWIKASNASDVVGYITDVNGVPYPLKDISGSGGITTLINTDGNLVITGANSKVINIAPALLSIINSALQSGDNISELFNDVGYITSSSLPVNTSDLINDGEDGTSVYVEQDDLGAVAFSNDYNDLDNKPTIPTVITNHSGLNLDDGTNPHGTIKGDVGLGSVDNTSDIDKPISTATQDALNLKLDKVSTAGVERAYVINADGSQGTKATSEFKDVLEYANLASFPVTGETSKIYLALDTNKTFRWSGSVYVQIGGINQDLYPIKYLYQATGTGMGTYGTNVMLFQGTQSDVYGSGNGNSYRKIVSATTAGTSIYAKESSFYRVLPNKGFQFLLRFRIADAATISDVRGFHGLQVVSSFSNTDISANTQPMCGIGFDGTDTNIHIFSRQVVSGTLVKIDTGFSKTLNHEYLLTQERLPNSNNVVVTLKNLTTSTEFTSTVVNNSSNLTIVNHRNNNASTLSCGFEIQRQELNLSE